MDKTNIHTIKIIATAICILVCSGFVFAELYTSLEDFGNPNLAIRSAADESAFNLDAANNRIDLTGQGSGPIDFKFYEADNIGGMTEQDTIKIQGIDASKTGYIQVDNQNAGTIKEMDVTAGKATSLEFNGQTFDLAKGQRLEYKGDIATIYGASGDSLTYSDGKGTYNLEIGKSEFVKIIPAEDKFGNRIGSDISGKCTIMTTNGNIISNTKISSRSIGGGKDLEYTLYGDGNKINGILTDGEVSYNSANKEILARKGAKVQIPDKGLDIHVNTQDTYIHYNKPCSQELTYLCVSDTGITAGTMVGEGSIPEISINSDSSLFAYINPDKVVKISQDPLHQPSVIEVSRNSASCDTCIIENGERVFSIKNNDVSISTESGRAAVLNFQPIPISGDRNIQATGTDILVNNEKDETIVAYKNCDHNGDGIISSTEKIDCLEATDKY